MTEIGSVFMETNKSKLMKGLFQGNPVVVKTVRSITSTEEHILTKIKCPYLLHPLYISSHDQIEIGFPEASCDLFELIYNRKCSNEDKIKMSIDIISGIKCLHENNIIHLDIKPENILIFGDNCQVCDFDTSIHLDEDKYFKVISWPISSTLGFVPPEISFRPGFAIISRATDVWALGATLYELFTSEQFIPNSGLISLRIYQQTLADILLTDKFNEKLSKIEHAHVRSIIKSMLSFNVSLRPNICQVLSAFQEI